MTRTSRCLVRVVAVCAALAGLPAGTAAAADPVVFAAGDIACDPANPLYNAGAGTTGACRQRATSDIIAGQPSDAVLALGDQQYEVADPAAFQQAYAPTWGRFKAKTYPLIGNHEGTTAGSGAGHCAYWGAAAHCNASGNQSSAAYFSFDIGTWHIVYLNSNCAAAGGCSAGTPQYNWLAADLAAHPNACTLAAWHEPSWSSGFTGPNTFTHPLWKLVFDNGGDVVLSGHDHDYERFAPLDGNGVPSPADGMRQFVVGTGGNSLGPFPSIYAGSEVRENRTYGVLRLVLHPTSYDWTFVPEAGRTFTDSGSQACRTTAPPAPAPAPPPPPAVAATTAAAPPAARPAPAAVSVAPIAQLGANAIQRIRLKSRLARRVLARRVLIVGARKMRDSVIEVRVGGRLAARIVVHTKRRMKVRLPAWAAQRGNRRKAVIVTIRPLT